MRASTASLDITPENAARFCALVMQAEDRLRSMPCPTGHELIGGVCVAPCPERHHRNAQGQCVPVSPANAGDSESSQRWLGVPVSPANAGDSESSQRWLGLPEPTKFNKPVTSKVRPAGATKTRRPAKFVGAPQNGMVRAAGCGSRMVLSPRVVRPAGQSQYRTQQDCELNGYEWDGRRCNPRTVSEDFSEYGTPGGTGGQPSAYDQCVADQGTSCELLREVETGGKAGQYSRPTPRETSALQWVTGISGIATGLIGTFLSYDQRNQALELQRERLTADNELSRLRLQNNPANAATIASLQQQIAANQQNASALAAQIQAALQAQVGVGMPVWGWIFLGVAGLAVVGGGMYVVMSRRPARD